MTHDNVIDTISGILRREMPLLLSLADDDVGARRNSQQRTVKMLVGHLIDSASNNHQRMVRLQYAPRCGHSMPNTDMGMLVFPDYTQDNNLWLHIQDYQHEDWHLLLTLLQAYNMHLCHVIRSIDASKLRNYWIDYEGHHITLDEMVTGYVRHMQLHFAEIHDLLSAE